VSRFNLYVNTDNAPFQDDMLDAELARILRNVADRIEATGTPGHYLTIFDANGNDVGRFAHKED
jgi:hypothetical protein